MHRHLSRLWVLQKKANFYNFSEVVNVLVRVFGVFVTALET